MQESHVVWLVEQVLQGETHAMYGSLIWFLLPLHVVVDNRYPGRQFIQAVPVVHLIHGGVHARQVEPDR